MQNRQYLQNIDKTKSLEEGISRFPSIYIEGNAAVGKSTAVTMLLEKHPETDSYILDVAEESQDCKKFTEILEAFREKMKQETIWLVFENIPKSINEAQAKMMAKTVLEINNNSKVIFVSRETPKMEFLNLLWKGKMQIIGTDKLFFTEEEIAHLAAWYESRLCPEEIYEKTRGWAGCTDLLFRLSYPEKNVEELLNSYEVKTYIQNEILGQLDESERQILEKIAQCPWGTVDLCEQVWGMLHAGDRLSDLQRKGFLIYDSPKKRWKIIEVFQSYITANPCDIKHIAKWYGQNGYIMEAAGCLKKLQDDESYRKLIFEHYDEASSLGIIGEEVLTWEGKEPELCYLRGAHYYSIKAFDGLKKEIRLLEKIKEKDHRTREILINLLYRNVEITLLEWMNLVAEYRQEDEKFRLYQILGNSVTYLCGIRDLSGLFACSKKEEKQRADFWKETFGNIEWECYCLAKMDYYLETDRKDSVNIEEWILLTKESDEKTDWQLRVAKLYLLCKLQRIQPEEERKEQILHLRTSLLKETSSVCRAITDSITCLYATWYGERDRMSKWLRVSLMDSNVSVNEENYLMFYCRAKGYILLNQYDRADKILRKLVPYLKEYHRYRLLAEAVFQCALVGWNKELRGQAIKNAIESLVVTGNSRYVIFYAAYGQSGLQVLEAYAEWMRNNAPEGWKQKKKYNYGNVLRMQVEDYVQVILRSAKKALKKEGVFDTMRIQEHLTMMETIVLQDIGMGKSNAQICQELELKLPTVKGHIYSLFKKLGVNSRVQAVIKGKELGILE